MTEARLDHGLNFRLSPEVESSLAPDNAIPVEPVQPTDATADLDPGHLFPPGDQPSKDVRHVDLDGDGKPDREITTESGTDSNGMTQTTSTEKDNDGNIVKSTTEKTYTDGTHETEKRELNSDGTVTGHGEKTFGPNGDVKETWDAQKDKEGNQTTTTVTESQGTKEVEKKQEDARGNIKSETVRTDNLGTTTTNFQGDDNGNSTTTVVVTNNDGSKEGYTRQDEVQPDGTTKVTTTTLDGKQTVSVGKFSEKD